MGMYSGITRAGPRFEPPPHIIFSFLIHSLLATVQVSQYSSERSGTINAMMKQHIVEYNLDKIDSFDWAYMLWIHICHSMTYLDMMACARLTHDSPSLIEKSPGDAV